MCFERKSKHIRYTSATNLQHFPRQEKRNIRSSCLCLWAQCKSDVKSFLRAENDRCVGEKNRYNFLQEIMKKYSQTVHTKVVERIYGLGRGSVFTPIKFQDLGSPKAIHHALSRHTRAGTIRKLARGLYDYPRVHSKLGVLAPSSDAIAAAIKGRDAVRIQPSGAYAANLLGLSEQVPMRIVFLTDGPARTVKVGKQQILLKPTTPRNMAMAGRVSGLVTQALRHLGENHVDDRTVDVLRRRFNAEEKKQLLKDIRYPPAWIADVFRQVASDTKRN